ncbi:Inositol-pentakisphosphate 2-kinase [Ptychographa xylographoides]|nr:Inositol-pentakisphosphate 2-kinase [Ptychographa xylographoides]
MTVSSYHALASTISLTYYAEGGANILYRISSPPSTPPSSSVDDYGPGTPPPSEIDFASSSESDIRARYIEKRLLRLRKDLSTTTSVEEAQSYYVKDIAPIFNEGELVEQEIVRLPVGLVGSLNAHLELMEREGRREKGRVGTRLADWEGVGVCVLDMSAEGYRGEGEVVCVEFKPKWLAQSPSAPVGARRCRTCALREMRSCARGELGVGKGCWCPLDLVSQDRKKVEKAVGAISVGVLRDKKVEERFIDWVLSSGLLERLRDVQMRMDPHGVIDTDTTAKAFRAAMTLRDCTLFLRIPLGEGNIEARLADLDLKSSAKAQYWADLEKRLIDEDWYAVHMVHDEAKNSACSLAERG